MITRLTTIVGIMILTLFVFVFDAKAVEDAWYLRIVLQPDLVGESKYGRCGCDYRTEQRWWPYTSPQVQVVVSSVLTGEVFWRGFMEEGQDTLLVTLLAPPPYFVRVDPNYATWINSEYQLCPWHRVQTYITQKDFDKNSRSRRPNTGRYLTQKYSFWLSP